MNNSSKSAGKSTSNSAQTQPDGTTKIWSADKKYYVLCNVSGLWDMPRSLEKYNNICTFGDTPTAVVFEAQSNQPIALLSYAGDDGDRYRMIKECAIKKYAGYQIGFGRDDSTNSPSLTVLDNRNNLIPEVSNCAREVQKA